MVSAHAAALHRAARLCALTVAWNVIVGGASVATAVATGSLSLIGFGINAVVDSSASAVLVWRFRAEASGHHAHAQRGERLALRLAGTAFALVATYLAVEATRSLMHSRHVEATAFGLGEAVASLIVLPRLASGKYSLSRRLGSPALRADSLLSWSGAALALLTLVALTLQSGFGWSWSDPVGALLIALVLGSQATRAFRDA
jgi:divalent metal cation (Fe/Co/Zn/Cd) transporter